jgi:hypothetical protein
VLVAAERVTHRVINRAKDGKIGNERSDIRYSRKKRNDERHTIAQRLHRYCNAIAMRLQYDCTAIAMRLLSDWNVITERLQSDCKAIAKR